MFKVPGDLLVRTNKVYLNFKSIKLKHEWITPQGFDTGIKVYCRKKDEKVPLIILNKNFVKWYLCGPTVYNDSHIGHASCYIRFDIINRILREFFNIKSLIALGITDIDDKIIIQAFKKKVEFRTLAKQYEIEFFNQLNELNILPPSFVLRVAEHIPDILNFISKIIEKGDAYATEDGSVYFNNPEPEEPSKPIPSEVLKGLKPGQKSHSDFALWKGAKPDEPYWESPWGIGRPGWHIECSAMASKLFGSQLDIHGGGIDLRFPHHANEESQSCSYHGCDQWVNYWIHTGELEIMNVKMSKSLNNFISISDFLKTYTADNLRMFCFISKYSKGLHYCSDSMTLAVSLCDLICRFLSDADSYVKGNWSVGNVSESVLLQLLEETRQNVRTHLTDDFDTSHAHLALLELIKAGTKMLHETPEVSSSRSPVAVAAVAQYVRDVYRSFGFHLEAVKGGQASKEERKMEFIVNQVVNFRNQVRAEALQCQEKAVKGNLLKACDSVRREFQTVGIAIKDQGMDKSAWNLEDKSSAESVC